MDKIAKKTLNEKLKFPFIVALIGVLILVVGMFLPYITAVGEMGEYIEKYPDRIEIEDLELTASDLKDIPVISVSQIIAGIYGEDDGTLANVIVFTFCSFVVLTALFVAFKKPIAVMIFELLAYGVFAFLSAYMKEDFIDPDKYAWGIGYTIIQAAVVLVFAAAIWMLVKKIIAKRELKVTPITEPVAPVAETSAE